MKRTAKRGGLTNRRMQRERGEEIEKTRERRKEIEEEAAARRESGSKRLWKSQCSLADGRPKTMAFRQKW